MTVQSLRDLFEFELGRMYYVEQRLVDALDEMARDATNDTLSEGFAEHRDETRRQVERLETVFEELGSVPEEREDPIVDALIGDKESFDDLAADDDIRNVYYNSAGIKTERFEITAYEGLLMLADRLDLGRDVTNPLEENLDEEKSARRELKAVAEGSQFKQLLDRLL